MSLKLSNLETANAIRIAAIQQAFIDAGFQWIEHIFNDGRYNNCSIKFTLSKVPSYFTYWSVRGDVGWGRFDRMECWEKAYKWLQECQAGTEKWPEQRTEPYKKTAE